jgi:hypothetical protein
LIGETVDAGLGDVTDGADILANDLAETNPCGFGSVRGPDPDFNGLVDLNSDMTITAVDSCDNCFFGLDLDSGFVVEQGAESLDLTPATDSNATGTAHTVTARRGHGRRSGRGRDGRVRRHRGSTRPPGRTPPTRTATPRSRTPA